MENNMPFDDKTIPDGAFNRLSENEVREIYKYNEIKIKGIYQKIKCGDSYILHGELSNILAEQATLLKLFNL